AAQMLATGKAFNIFLGWEFATGVWIGGLVTVIYTSFGGFKAVAYTDTVQGVLMLFALMVIPVVGLPEVGGFSGLWAGLQNVDVALTSPWVIDDSSTVVLIAVASSLAIGLPFIGVPQLLVRFMAIKDTAEVPKAATVSILVILLFDLGAVATGLVGRVLFPDLADPENVMPTLAKALFSPVVTGILVVAVLSAVMSTVSSLLNLASSAIVHDLYQKIRHPESSGKHEAKLGQWTTLALG
ncbi:MAG: sodium/proline symporter, partial [Planctomycetaceae bacterium]|nr:sodium/proline symporter [Planctomycetaceae bacterium]